MKLQRYFIMNNPDPFAPDDDGDHKPFIDVPHDHGAWVRSADVDALLARIREAVVAEREAVFREQNLRLSAPDHEVADTCQATDDARAALDALLSGEG